MVGLDEAEHRAGEQHQQPGEPAEVGRVGREVASRVDQDRHADRADDERHRGREAVEPQVDRQVQTADPAQRARSPGRRR